MSETKTTKFERYLYESAYSMMPFSESDYVILGEDVFVPNVLPRSGAGITLKAGTYIDGVRQDD